MLRRAVLVGLEVFVTVHVSNLGQVLSFARVLTRGYIGAFLVPVYVSYVIESA